MADSDMKAIKEIANNMEYVANEAVNNAPYDKTMNARITEVVVDGVSGNSPIVGYWVSVAEKKYYIKKQIGSGIIAKKDDIVKLHIPCNNPNAMYLSYAHDPEDVVKKYVSYGLTEYEREWSNNRTDAVWALFIPNVVFPTTSHQFSVAVERVYLPKFGKENIFTFQVIPSTFAFGNVIGIYSDDIHWILDIRLFSESSGTQNVSGSIRADGYLDPFL